MNPSEHIHDFQRRYQGTIVMVKLPPKEEFVPMLVSAIEYVGDCEASMTMSSNVLGKIRLNMANEYEMKFEFPECGVFQLHKDAIVFRRLPKRQWRKGICSENSAVFPVYHRVVDAKGPALTTETVSAALEKKCYSAQTGLDLLKQGYRSVALGNNFALCQSFNGDTGPVIFHWDRVIGTLSKGEKKIQLSEKIFSKEMSNLFPKMEIVYV